MQVGVEVLNAFIQGGVARIQDVVSGVDCFCSQIRCPLHHSFVRQGWTITLTCQPLCPRDVIAVEQHNVSCGDFKSVKRFMDKGQPHLPRQ